MKAQVDLDLGDLLHTFVIPHIHDLDDQRYHYNLDVATAKLEGLSRAAARTFLFLPNCKKKGVSRFFFEPEGPRGFVCLFVWFVHRLRKP